MMPSKLRIEKALQADSSLKDSSISVKSVNKGVVLLDCHGEDLECSPASRRDCSLGAGRGAGRQ